MVTSETYLPKLLNSVTNGDERAFNELFGLYRNRMYSYLLNVTKSKQLAEEATLDVFLKIWTARNILNEINNFEAFLFRIAHNKAIDYLRVAQKSKLQQLEIWTEMEVLAATDTSDGKLLTGEANLILDRIINQLTPQRREAFRLSKDEYLSYDEIAKRMNISKNTVRNHISSALAFIRGNLENGVEISSIIMLASKLY